MRASVCLCTLDGERYLPPLLESLAGQTLQPFQLLVADDGSRDATVSILRHFARRAPFPVEVTVNPARLGPYANLEQLLARASGDVLLPCDQDDVWEPGKVAALVAALERHPGAGAAVADSSLIDGEGRPLHGTLFRRVGLDPATRRALLAGSGVLQIADRNVVAAHALALRATARQLVLPFGAPGYADWWIALVLAATTGIAVLDECLVAYRLHATNTAGLVEQARLGERVTAASSARYTRRAALIEAAVARIDERCPARLGEPERRELMARARHLRLRASLPPNRARRLPDVAREALAGRYARYGSGWRSAVTDLLAARHRAEP